MRFDTYYMEIDPSIGIVSGSECSISPCSFLKFGTESGAQLHHGNLELSEMRCVCGRNVSFINTK